MENTDKVLIRLDWIKAVEHLPANTRCGFYEALFKYARSRELPDNLDATLQALFLMAKPVIDKDQAAYTRRCEINAENGKKGGRPSSKKNIQTNYIIPSKSMSYAQEKTEQNPTVTKQNPTVTEQNPTVTESTDEELKYLETIANLDEQQDFNAFVGAMRKKERIFAAGLFFEFFKSGVIDYMNTTVKAFSYYKLQNFTIKGVETYDFRAVAKYWKTEKNEYLEQKRQKWSELCQIIKAPMYKIFTDFHHLQKSDTDLFISMTNMSIINLIEKKMNQNATEVRKWLKKQGIIDVTYTQYQDA